MIIFIISLHFWSKWLIWLLFDTLIFWADTFEYEFVFTTVTLMFLLFDFETLAGSISGDSVSGKFYGYLTEGELPITISLII